MIRAARPADAERLRAIERAAGARFRDVGMPHIADDEPMSAETLVAYADAGRAWVAADSGDVAVGYIVVDITDRCAHVEQVSVHPDHQGQGLSRQLLDEVERWASRNRLPAITLTTFSEVPWNRPLYEHLGFRVVGEDELTPGLRALRDTEAEHGLNPVGRVCMRRVVNRLDKPAGRAR